METAVGGMNTALPMSDSDREEPDKKREHASSDEEAADQDDPIQSRLMFKKARSSNIFSSPEEENSDEPVQRRSLEQRQASQRRGLEKKLRRKATKGAKGKSSIKAVDETSARSKERCITLDGKSYTRAEAMAIIKKSREEKRKKERCLTVEGKTYARAAAMEIIKKARKVQREKDAKQKKAAVTQTTGSDSEPKPVIPRRMSMRLRIMKEIKAQRQALRLQRRAEREQKAAVQQTQTSDSESNGDLPDVERKNWDCSSIFDSDVDDSSDESNKKEQARVEDVGRVRLLRSDLVTWMYQSHFQDTVIGCFVLVKFGDTNMYKIAEIVGVGEARQLYPVDICPARSDTAQHTHVTLRVKVADREKHVKLTDVSNSVNRITPQEFAAFKKCLQEQGLPLPTREHLEKKARDLDAAKSYRTTHDDLNRMMEIKANFANNPQKQAVKKADLVHKQSVALLSRDHAAAARFQAELDGLKAQTQVLDAPRQQNQAKLEQINQRNKALTLTRLWGTSSMLDQTGTPTTAPAMDAVSAMGSGSGSCVAKTGPDINGNVDPFGMPSFDIGIAIDLGLLSKPSLPSARRSE